MNRISSVICKELLLSCIFLLEFMSKDLVVLFCVALAIVGCNSAGVASNLTYNNCTDFYCVSCNPYTPDICTRCSSGYFVSTNYHCVRCSSVIPYCETCYPEFIGISCTSCDIGRVLSNNACPLCSSLIPYCSTCDNTYTCTKCQPGFIDDNRGSICKQCSTYVNKCTRCRHSGTIVECIKCGESLVAVSNVCIPCETAIRNCSSCQQRDGGGYGCLKCKNGLFTDGSKCKPCEEWIDDCVRCDPKYSKASCEECVQGRYVSVTGSRCLSRSEKVWEIVGIVGGVLLVVSVGIGIFCYRRRKNRPRKQQSLLSEPLKQQPQEGGIPNPYAAPRGSQSQFAISREEGGSSPSGPTA